MLEITKDLRPKSLIPPYPNYHTGYYFEEYFFKRFTEEYPTLSINKIKYIPIFWTNCYTNKSFNNQTYNIQKQLNLLDNNEQYFTISQHDDCVYEKLPDNTLIFSMGGNKIGKKIIPIPLICSPLNYEKKIKDIKISFVGSLTHPIRDLIYNLYKNNDNFKFDVKNWELITEEKNIEKFFNITARSEFTLCPRGYGKSSFRLYESMQLDSIPVYVFDQPWLPWETQIEWDKFCILIPTNEISNIQPHIENTNINSFLKYKNKIYDEYFSFDGVYKNIIKILKNGNF
jgi:hypothetical protein